MRQAGKDWVSLVGNTLFPNIDRLCSRALLQPAMRSGAGHGWSVWLAERRFILCPMKNSEMLLSSSLRVIVTHHLFRKRWYSDTPRSHKTPCFWFNCSSCNAAFVWQKKRCWLQDDLTLDNSDNNSDFWQVLWPRPEWMYPPSRPGGSLSMLSDPIEGRGVCFVLGAVWLIFDGYRLDMTRCSFWSLILHIAARGGCRSFKR